MFTQTEGPWREEMMSRCQKVFYLIQFPIRKIKNLQISYVLIFFAFTVILLYKRASAHSDLGDIWVIISYDATQAAVVL